MKLEKINIEQPESINKIIENLKSGIIIVIKTDTQWGVICKDQLPIYELKKRDPNKKLIKFVTSNFEFNDLDEKQKEFIGSVWPGKTTIIHNGESYRKTTDEKLNFIIDSFNDNLYSSSANISGLNPINSIEEFQTTFNDYSGDILFVVDSNSSSNTLPSTIVNIDNWEVIRKGINYNDIDSIIKKVTKE
ncbi:MAG: L-threonylcarbamoyladenylate synthase [Mycoplasma sp.]